MNNLSNYTITESHAEARDKVLAEREAERKFRHYFCDGCGKQDTFENPQGAIALGWTWGQGYEFCLGCSY